MCYAVNTHCAWVITFTSLSILVWAKDCGAKVLLVQGPTCQGKQAGTPPTHTHPPLQGLCKSGSSLTPKHETSCPSLSQQVTGSWSTGPTHSCSPRTQHLILSGLSTASVVSVIISHHPSQQITFSTPQSHWPGHVSSQAHPATHSLKETSKLPKTLQSCTQLLLYCHGKLRFE